MLLYTQLVIITLTITQLVIITLTITQLVIITVTITQLVIISLITSLLSNFNYYYIIIVQLGLVIIFLTIVQLVIFTLITSIKLQNYYRNSAIHTSNYLLKLYSKITIDNNKITATDLESWIPYFFHNQVQ